MDRPQKIKGVRYDKGSNSQKWMEGYNQACDEYEKWISKNRREMIEIGGIRKNVIVLGLDDEI